MTCLLFHTSRKWWFVHQICFGVLFIPFTFHVYFLFWTFPISTIKQVAPSFSVQSKYLGNKQVLECCQNITKHKNAMLILKYLKIIKCILFFLYKVQSEFKCKHFVETLHVNFWFGAISYILYLCFLLFFNHCASVHMCYVSIITLEHCTLQVFSYNLILFYGTVCF